MRDRDPVIAARCGDYAGFWNFASQKIGEGAAGFERAGMLQKFQFEDEADRIQAEVGASDFENGRAADVGPDDLFDGGDLRSIEGNFVHRVRTLSAACEEESSSLGCARDDK
jgi:hypothetical protein